MASLMNFEKLAKICYMSLGDMIDFPSDFHSDPMRLFSDYFDHLNKNYKSTGILERGSQIEIDNIGLLNSFEDSGQWYLVDLHKLMLKTLSDITITLCKYWEYGYKTFNVSSGLTSLLHSTDLAGTYQFLKFPYSCFYINLESCPVYLSYRDDHVQIDGVYVDATNPNRVVFMGISSPDVENYLTSSCLWVRACIDSERSLDEKISINHFNFGGVEVNPVIELAVKVLLYLNSESADTKKSNEYADVLSRVRGAKEKKKRDRLSLYLEKITSNEYFDVGRSIKISKKDVGSADRVTNVDGFHYSYRFWVRGHFRKQVCGDMGMDRKLIWIKPHMKGPDGAKVIHRKYSVV